MRLRIKSARSCVYRCRRWPSRRGTLGLRVRATLSAAQDSSHSGRRAGGRHPWKPSLSEWIEKASRVAAAMSELRHVIRLIPGETALVGYGSLLSRPSLERTLGRTYTGPFLRCTVRGWRRTWDAAMPNRQFYTEGPEGRTTPRAILYLNVKRDPSMDINGVIFVVDDEELAAYD